MKTAPIELAPYSPAWPGLFAQEQRLLVAALQPWLVGDIEHIGSTAIPGLSAKPVIDIMAPVQGLEEALPAIPALRALGYVYFPYKPDEMHWFCKPSFEHRTHHLHIVPLGSESWHRRLAFRNALRQDPALAAAYQRLKLRWAAIHQHDREAYTDAKGQFIDAVITRHDQPHAPHHGQLPG